jgi:hypothetical protein
MQMLRLLLALALAGGLMPQQGPALAAQGPTPLHPAAPRPADAATARLGRLDEPLVITRRTAILLDGSPCQYEQLPEGAVITAAEVAADRKTLLRVHFRSPRGPGLSR